MTKTARILVAASVALGASAFMTAAPAVAQDAVSLSANVALTTDYRFRGVSRSDQDPAIQGGFDASLGQFYVGTWASSIEQFNGAETEVDLYGGWGTELGSDMFFDVGFLYYVFPDGVNTDYYELYTSLSGAVQSVDWTVGAAYNPDQDNLGDEDNLYVYGDLGYTIPDTPFYLGGHLGYEDGARGNPDLTGNDSKLDWSLKAGVTYQAWDISVSYVDTDESCGNCGATGLVTLGAAF